MKSTEDFLNDLKIGLFSRIFGLQETIPCYTKQLHILFDKTKTIEERKAAFEYANDYFQKCCNDFNPYTLMNDLNQIAPSLWETNKTEEV